MRKSFVTTLQQQMTRNKNIWLLVGDVGYGVFDGIAAEFPERFINCGVSENAMIGMAAGLAASGKIPLCYSISPFLLYRPYEFLRILASHDKANIKLIASGRGQDYADHNFTHLAVDEKQVLETLPNIRAEFPGSALDIPAVVSQMLWEKGPWYLSLKRS